MTPYAAADPELAAYERSHLDMVRYARWALWGMVLLHVGIAVLIPVIYGASIYDDPQQLRSPAPAVVGGLCAAMALLSAAALPLGLAIVGLNRGARWGWWLTIGIGLLYLPFPCPPAGPFLLFAMLNGKVRTAFLG